MTRLRIIRERRLDMTAAGCCRLLTPVLVSAFLAVPGLAQEGKQKEIKTYDLPDEPTEPGPKQDEEKKAPMGIKALTTRPEAMADDKLEAAIQALDELIEMTAGDDPSKPEFLARKAELYWDKAENYFNKAYGDDMFHRLKAAQDSGDEGVIASTEAEQKAFLNARLQWQLKTIRVYEDIVENYPEYPALDSVLYYLGYTLVQMDRGADAFPFFSRIIREFPTSDYSPNALLNIGEFYFNSGRMDDASMIYQEVENFPMSAAYGLAIYKKGWCLYNMGEHEAAMSQFLRVIDYARSDAAKAVGYGKQLLREAQRDLVMVYSQVGNPENAVRVFKKISPTDYMTLAIRLAEGYSSQGEYVKSIRLFKSIIAEFAEGEESHRIVEFQRSILMNAYRLGIAAAVVEETRRLIGLLDKFQDTAPRDFITFEMDKAELMVRIIATTYHKEVAVTREAKTMEFTHLLYREYLRLFPDAAERYNMTLNYAQLLTQVDKFAEAAEQFSAAVQLRPDGDQAREAAREAVANYYKLLDLSRQQEVKSADASDLKPRELPEFEKKLVAASNRYLSMVQPDAPNVVEARFAAAMVQYDHNHFDEASAGFRRIIEDNPEHPNAPDAARLLLSSLHLQRDISGLNAVAEEIARRPELMQGDVPGIVTRIREQADFNKCYEFEKNRRHRTAAECFLEYVRQFPDTPLKDRSLINAGNNFFKARLVERSLQANTQLFNDMPDSPLAPRALYNVGEIYRRLAVYSEAARFYEIFVKMLPRHELTEKALRYATVFRRGLGEYDAAVIDLRKYLGLFKDSDHVASITFDIGAVREKQGRHRHALKHFNDFIRDFGKSAGLDLFLKAHLKVAQMYKAGKSLKNTLKWYANTVDAYEEMTAEEKDKLGSIGLSAVAEARFMQGEAVLKEVRKVQVRGNQQQIAVSIDQKLRLMKDAMDVFESVSVLGQPHWTIAALSRKGFAFQALAESIENVPPPRKFNAQQEEMFRGGLTQKALPVWEKAKNEFKSCVAMAKKLKWYNTFSEQAEEAMLRLDPEFKAMPDIRPSPGAYSLILGRPRLLQFREGKDAPRWTDSGVKSRIRNAAEGTGGSAAVMYNMGALLEVDGDLDGAVSWYKKAIAGNAGLADAVARLGMIALHRGDPGAAMSRFEEALKIDPANSVAHNYEAKKAIDAGDYAEAINHARMALVSDPDSMDAYLNLDAAYYEMGLLDVGVLVGRNALGLNSDDAPIQNMLGLIFSRRGKVRDAVRLFEDAVQDDHDLFDARMNLGAVTLGYKDFGIAATQFGKAVELRPASTSAKMGLAVAKRGMGEGKEALRILTGMADRDPGNADVRYNLCILRQETLGDYEKALSECRQFVNMVTAHPKLKQAEHRIEGLEMIIEALEMEDVSPPAEEPVPEEGEAVSEEETVENEGEAGE